MKKFLAITLVVMMALSFVACSNEKDSQDEDALTTYTTQAGLTIQMEAGFTEEEQDGFDVVLAGPNSDVYLVGIREGSDVFSDLGYDFSTISLSDYAAMVQQANGTIDEYIEDSEGNLSTSYTSTVDDVVYYYYSVVKQGDDCFWVTTFFCANDDATEYAPKFATWAATMEVK